MTESTNQQGTFIMLDGIDGSGKSTIISVWATYLEALGKRVFYLKEYWELYGAHPTPADAMEYDVIISAEPTSVWIGAAIRQEMIQQGNSYSAIATAHAYALDRLILYTRFLLPLRAAGKLIIQDRGVSTSLCYQSLQGDIPLSTLAAIEGNAFALDHAPDALVLTHIDPTVALSRIDTRYEKQDNAIFEQQNFLIRAHEQFHSEAYQSYFTTRGTDIHIMPTDISFTAMGQAAEKILTTIIDIV
jgi:thymidylate kinase